MGKSFFHRKLNYVDRTLLIMINDCRLRLRHSLISDSDKLKQIMMRHAYIKRLDTKEVPLMNFVKYSPLEPLRRVLGVFY